MTETTIAVDMEKRIRQELEAAGVAFEIIDCDPALADTAQFCAHYGYDLANSANAILVRSKTGEEKNPPHFHKNNNNGLLWPHYFHKNNNNGLLWPTLWRCARR